MLGHIHTAQKKYDNAEKAFQKSIDLRPEWQAPHNAWARLSIIQGKTDEAIEKLESALKANPKNFRAYLTLGNLYHQSKAYSNAIAVYEKAVEVNPSLWFAANNLAFIISEQTGSPEDLEKALNYARKASRSRPNEPRILDTIGWIYYKMGKFDRALGHLDRALYLSPDDPTLNYHIGMVLYKRGQIEAAKIKLKKALESNEPFEGQEKAEKTLAEIG
jgi:tetratricopeptide (TPR) repeat protein